MAFPNSEIIVRTELKVLLNEDGLLILKEDKAIIIVIHNKDILDIADEIIELNVVDSLNCELMFIKNREKYYKEIGVKVFTFLKSCTIILSQGKTIYLKYFSELILEASKLKMLFEEVKLMKKINYSTVDLYVPTCGVNHCNNTVKPT